MNRILVIDDNPSVAEALALLCEVSGHDPVIALNPQSGVECLSQDHSIDLVIQDMNFSRDATTGEEGRDLFYALREVRPDIPVILITAWGELEMAVELVKAGAADYMTKPWDDSKLLACIGNLLELRELQQESLKKAQSQLQAQTQLKESYDLCGIIYRSDAMQRLLETAITVAKADVPVLITGPNGAGKEKIAEIVKANSALHDQAFIKVNAGALPSELIEAELFGAEAGAFTGAQKSRIGRFEAANGGTLFLDEIGNLPLNGQIKLLRVLQTGDYERLGSTDTLNTKIRLICATNADLPKAIEEQTFRQDLYYRINVIELKIPSLAERAEDIAPLARYFLPEEKQLSISAIRALEQHDWPGNVRELQNLMHRVSLLVSGSTIHSQDLGLESAQVKRRKLVFEPDRAMIEQALRDNHGVVARAAKQLGLSRQALYRRMDKYQLSED